MARSNLSPILSGVIAGVMFLLPMITGGELVAAFASAPLLYAGLGQGTRAALGAALTAIIMVTLGTGGGGATLNFILVNAAPAVIFTHYALKCRIAPPHIQWMPAGLVMTELAGFAALAIAATILGLEWGGQGATEALRAAIAPNEAELPPQTAAMLKQMLDNAPFLLMGMMGWFTLLMVYANAAIANYLLKHNNKVARPSLGLGAYIPPAWLLWGLALMALGAVIGSPSTQLMAKTLLLVLLFPYFLFGLSLLHRATESWPSRSLVRALLYLAIIFAFWPAFFIAVYGLWKQAALLSKGGE